MALVRVFSDLHLEFGIKPLKKCVEICSTNRTKYLILAGDITNFKNKEQIITQLAKELNPLTERVIYILGNHEYYELGKTKATEVVGEYRKICNNVGITLLENEHLETDDFTFYGATMWSDMTETAFSKMNDQFSFGSRKEIVDTYKHSKEKLETFLSNYNSKKPLAVITHHLPSFSLIDQEYKKYASMNSGFASELDYLIKDPIGYWIYGHTHKPNNSVINGVKMLCNPHGYPKERKDTYTDCTF